jgi:hypothetical protein
MNDNMLFSINDCRFRSLEDHRTFKEIVSDVMHDTVMFEINDDETRSKFVRGMVPYLRKMKRKHDIFDYNIITDSTVNTPDVIDRNEFCATIYLKLYPNEDFVELKYTYGSYGVKWSD